MLNPEFLEILNYSHQFTKEKKTNGYKEDTSDVDSDEDHHKEAAGTSEKKKVLSFMIEQSQKFEFDNDSPIHMAVRDSNTKLVNILLTYMSKIKNKGTRNFCELFGYLVEY